MTKDYGKDALISQTEHRRLSITFYENGAVSINETKHEGHSSPTVTVHLTKQELAKIAKKCGVTK